MNSTTESILHLRKDGETKYIELSKLNGIGANSQDSEIKRAVENHLDLGNNELEGFVVERLGNDISIRPSAIYG